MDLTKVRRYQLHKQRLDRFTPDPQRPPGMADMLALADHLIALHSTDYLTPYLSLFARLPGFQKQLFYTALNHDHSLVRINAMRTTLFVITRAMLPIIYMATRRQVRRAALAIGKLPELEENELRAAVLAKLEEQPLTAVQLKRVLSTTANLSGTIRRLMAGGLVIRGESSSWTSNIHRYTLTSKWLPDLQLEQLPPNGAIDALLRAYIHLFGPVSTEDIVWWSGLNKLEVVAAIGRIQKSDFLYRVNFAPHPWDDLEYYMSVEDYDAYEHFEPGDADIVNLLPYEDLFPKGYIERAWYLDDALTRTIFTAYGEIRPTIWLNGEIIGWWELKRAGAVYYILPELLKPTPSHIREQIDAHCQATERFLNDPLPEQATVGDIDS